MIAKSPLTFAAGFALFLVASGGFAMPASAGGASQDVARAKAQSPAMLPNRRLDCILGRATNIDSKKNQTVADITYEGSFKFSLFLPAIPVRTGPPPEPIDPPEPVNPNTRILLDEAGLTKAFPNRFDRVVDYWPDRVEMTTTIDDPLVNMIIISDIDAGHSTANLFMTQATDVATFDMKHIYQGGCKVTSPKT